MTTNLLTIRSVNREDRENADLYPVATDKQSFELEDGESIAWQASAVLSGLRSAHAAADKVAWSLSAPADLFMTDRRLVYLCAKFEKGKQHLFTGGVGSAMMVGSTVKAALNRRGRVAAGHVRFQWPENVIFESTRGLVAGTSTHVLLTCHDGTVPDGSSIRLRLRLRGDNAQFAEDLVRRIADFRLNFAYQPPLSGDVTAALKTQLAEPAAQDLSSEAGRTTRLCYDLAGACPVPHLGS